MLGEPGGFAECLRRVPVLRATAVIPALGLQRIDAVHAAHQIHEAAAHRLTHILLFVFHIQGDHGFARLEEVEQEQFEQIALTLAGVAQDEDVGGGLIVIPLIKIYEDIGPVLVLADVESVRIGLARIIEGIQVGHRAGRKDPFKLGAEGVAAGRHNRNKALLLTEHKPVHIELGANQFGEHIGLEQLEGVVVRGGQLQEHRTVEERLPVAVHGGDQGNHILQVGLGGDSLLEILGAGAGHSVLVGGVVDDPALLTGGDLPGVDADGDPVHLAQMPQDGLLIGRSGVLPQRPYTAAGVAAQVVVHLEVDDRGGDHVEEILDIRFLHHRPGRVLFSVFWQ